MLHFYFPNGITFRFTLLLSLLFISFFAQAQPAINFRSVLTGLSSPIDIANAGDGSGRVFIVQQDGNIKVCNQATDQSLTNPSDFLTVSGITSGGERGLLSMAFHPDYKNNGFFFVYYNNTNGDIEIARYHTPPGTPNTADPNSKQVVLTIPHPGQSNHNGGKLNFGVDGYLYFATGDGGGAGDVPNNAQNGSSLLGKMLRINVNTLPYTIPPDNPFLVNGDNIRDEIWAFGLRNPFRWSFDRQTHDMWIGDVGQDAWEEVDFSVAASTGGLNYGWHCTEGTHDYNGGCTISAGVYAPPLFDYPHNMTTGGFAIIGGYVYRGTINTAMFGYYFFADNVSNNVWLLPPGGTVADTIEYKNFVPGITAFGEAENGELYATTLSGVVFNIIATNNSALPVKLLSFSGTAQSGYNELNWQIAEEHNLARYEVEYSTDGLNFQQAGVVLAAASSSYRFKHNIVTSKRLYYRLKMVDLDGKSGYSNTISLIYNSLLENNFVVPSIISNRTMGVNLDGTFINLQMLTMDGKEVYRQSLNSRTGRVSLVLPSLPPGQYVVVLLGNDRQVTQKVFVK